MKSGNDKKRANFSWTKQDFIDNRVEIPSSLLNDDVHTEGEMLNEDEIIEWINDTQKTFSIVREENEARFTELYKGFLLDLEYLVKIGKIQEESIDIILNPDDYHF